MALPFDSLTVQIDTREHYPMQFPSTVRIEDPDKPRSYILLPVSTERVKLDAGDYCLKEFPATCIVERKASLLELNKNLLDPKDCTRQLKAFAKLRDSCTVPILLMETSPWELSASSPRRIVIDPDAVMFRLAKVAAHYGLHILWTGRTTSATNRRHIGQLLIMLMVCHGLKGV